MKSSPFADLVGLAYDDDGAVRLETSDKHGNTSGRIQGGVIATLIDVAMGRAVSETLREGEGAATIQLSLTYLNAAKPGATLIARGKVGKRGKDVVMLSAGVATEDGQSLAEAVGTFSIITR